MNEAEVGGWLLARHGPHVAWVRQGQEVWFAAGERVPGRPWTPLVDLVQGVREVHGHADLVLRRRVGVSYDLEAWERDVVKVAARRAGTLPPSGPEDGQDVVVWTDVTSAADAARRRAAAAVPEVLPEAPSWLDLADALGGLGEPAPSRRHADRPVGAVLVSGEGRLLAAARNLTGRNRSLHAEVNLVQGWWMRHGAPLPAGAQVHVSLQPCRMCAGMLVACATHPGLSTVIFRRPDPGRLARCTALDGRRISRPERAGPDTNAQ